MRLVRRRAWPHDAVAAAWAAVLLAVSVAFAVSGARALPAFGGVLLLVVGVAGAALFAGRLVVVTGRAASGRPVLELDEREVRLPAAWPRSRANDRRLAWPDVAAAVVWREGMPRGRRVPPVRLSVLPTAEHAARTAPPPSPELVALRLEGVPGAATLRWSVTLPADAEADLDALLADVRRLGGIPVVDARSR